MRNGMEYLGVSQQQLESSGGFWTAREICQQPAVWADVAKVVARHAADLRAFLGPLLQRRELRVVLTGAGTSSFIGECLAPALRRAGLRADAVSTTDLVGSPDSWLTPVAPTLLVSFARSGNSPESVAALAVADQAAADCHHLIITCNPEGALYKQGQQLDNACVLLLPEATNDRGFAMTSSFSGMVLAAGIAFGLWAGESEPWQRFAGWSDAVLGSQLPFIEKLVSEGYERVVYLGSNELKGLAREAALKLLELSDGRIVALAETPMGFRHGPKTILNVKTLVVIFLGNHPHTRQYEMDLLRELRNDGVAGRVIALAAAPASPASPAAPAVTENDILVAGAGTAPDLSLCFPYIVFAQTLAFRHSLALGLKPDVPNVGGTVSRVVQGVTIHPWSGQSGSGKR
jgi:tagatose-6-phosphate ketose/aldose isomerase